MRRKEARKGREKESFVFRYESDRWERVGNALVFNKTTHFKLCQDDWQLAKGLRIDRIGVV